MPEARKRFYFIIAVYLITRLVLELIGILSLFYFPPASAIGPARDLHYHRATAGYLEIWARWDSEWYALIAERGYLSYDSFRQAGGGQYLPEETAKFFPVFPWTIRALNTVTHNSIISGLLSANLFLLLFLYYLFGLASRLIPDSEQNACMLYLLFPTSFFLSAVYSESLFLAAVVAAFYYMERKLLLPALLACAVTVLTRSQAVIALPAFLWLAWRAFPERRAVAVACVAAACVIPLAGYLFYIDKIFGSAKWVAASIAYWRGDMRYPFYAFVRFFSNPVAIHGQHNSIIDFCFAAAQVAVMVVSFRRLPGPYYLYSLLAVLFPLSSTLFSYSRLALANFPFFLFLARSGERAMTAMYIVFAMLLAFFFAAFANWYWVG